MKFSTSPTCGSLEDWAKRAGLRDIRVVIAEDERGVKEYVAYQGEKPIYANSSTEAVACYFDILGVADRKTVTAEKRKRR